MPKTFFPAVLLSASGLVTAALPEAADYDGSNNLLCASQSVMECLPHMGCEDVPAESIGAPDFIELNFADKQMTVPHSTHAPSRIQSQKTVDGKLIVQGVEDGYEDVRDGTGWTIAIDGGSGKMVATASGDRVAFIFFGSCIKF